MPKKRRKKIKSRKIRKTTRRITGKRGRPSIIGNEDLMNLKYQQYLRQYEETAKVYGENMSLALDYETFKQYYFELYSASGNRAPSMEKFVMQHVGASYGQGRSAAKHFNDRIRKIKEKLSKGEPLTEYETGLWTIFVKFGFRWMTPKDVRTKSEYYKAVIDYQDELEEDGKVSENAFGS